MPSFKASDNYQVVSPKSTGSISSVREYSFPGASITLGRLLKNIFVDLKVKDSISLVYITSQITPEGSIFPRSFTIGIGFFGGVMKML